MNSLNILDRHAYFLAFIFFLAFWSSILMGSGSVFSGYHFVDDHEILRIHNEISTTQNGIIVAIKDRMTDDFKLRFKPLHSIYRIMQISIFGANFTMLLAYAGILAVFTSLFLFLFFKKIGFSFSESILFPLLSLTGYQGVWWAAGINEAISMFLLSLTLIFMAYMIHSEKGRFICGLLFVIFAILMSLSKESFILMIPAIVFWAAWLYKGMRGSSFFDSIKRNMLPLVILLLVMFVELFIIVKWIGTGGYGGHAGGLDGFKPLLYLKTAKDMTLSISTIGLGLVIIPSILLMIFCSAEDGLYVKVKRFFKDFYYAIILTLLIVFPQFVIYGRSGVFGRYTLPLILGYSIFLLYIVKFLRTNNTHYSIKLPDRGLKMVYISCVILGLFLLTAGFALLYNQDMSRLLFSVLGKSARKESMDIFKPAMLSIALGIFIISIGWIIAQKKRVGRLAVFHVVLTLTVAAVIYKTMLTFAGAYEYATHGKDINLLFESVEKHTKYKDIILVAADPDVNYNEAGWSIKVYLNNMLKRENVYVYPIFVNDVDKIEMDRMAVSYVRMFEGKSLSSIENKGDIKHIIVFRELEQKFLSASKEWFDSSDFVRESSTFLITYYKNI